MAQKRRFLDVWLVEPNTVYREVPFTVVCDWVQQSRLLPDDMLRPSGTAQWFRVGESPDFQPYIPRAEPTRIEDEASALEPVHLDFSWKRAHEEEDDDVDMIPLIDISLVLLIFFIMTSTAATAAAIMNIPRAYNGQVIDPGKRMLWINVTLEGEEPRTVFSVNLGDRKPARGDDNLASINDVIDKARTLLDEQKDLGPVEATIRADRDVQSGIIRELTVELTKLGIARVGRKYIAVSEKLTP